MFGTGAQHGLPASHSSLLAVSGYHLLAWDEVGKGNALLMNSVRDTKYDEMWQQEERPIQLFPQCGGRGAAMLE